MTVKGTSSCIFVDIDDRTVRIQGEMIVTGFVAYADTIQCWEPPYDAELVDELTKQRIVNAVSALKNEAGYTITFE